MNPARILDKAMQLDIPRCRILEVECRSFLYPLLYHDFKPLLLAHVMFSLKEWLVDEECLIIPTQEELRALFNQMAFFRLREIFESPLIDILEEALITKIAEQSKDRFEDSRIASYLEYLDIKLSPVLSVVFETKRASTWKERLQFFIYKTLGSLLYTLHRNFRSLSIFEIIREYPDSIPSLTDLKGCLAQTGEIAELLTLINSTISERLLIIDAKTQSILEMFLSTKKCMLALGLPEQQRNPTMHLMKEYLS